MATANFNIRLDPELKAMTNEVLKKYGLTPTQAVKLFFNEIAQTKKVPLSFNYHAQQPNEITREAMQAFLDEHDRLEGMSVEQALSDMRKLAENEQS